MATKTITITEDAYAVLYRNKLGDESFSKEIVRLLKKKRSILDLAGAWSDISEKEARIMKETIVDFRRKGKIRT